MPRKTISATDDWGPWVQLSTAPGFSYNTGLGDYPSWTPHYKKHKSGLVVFVGLIRVNSAPPNSLLLTLPTAIRPIAVPASAAGDSSVYFPLMTSYSPYTSMAYFNASAALTVLNWSATVGAYYGAASMSNMWLSDPTL